MHNSWDVLCSELLTCHIIFHQIINKTHHTSPRGLMYGAPDPWSTVVLVQWKTCVKYCIVFYWKFIVSMHSEPYPGGPNLQFIFQGTVLLTVWICRCSQQIKYINHHCWLKTVTDHFHILNFSNGTQIVNPNTETKINLNHWLHWKLSLWQLSVYPVIKLSSKWRHFDFSQYLCTTIFNIDTVVTLSKHRFLSSDFYLEIHT